MTIPTPDAICERLRSCFVMFAGKPHFSNKTKVHRSRTQSIGRGERTVSDIQTRTIREQRIKIGAEMAWVRREGNSIVIDYDYAGRATRETERFYADDIERLAQFVKDTNP